MWRSIAKSKGRFIAIILIILLGTLIFVGVKAAGPALNDSLDQTVKKAKLSDVQLLSTTGFSKKDATLAEKTTKHTKAELIRFKYALDQRKNVVALYGYQKQQTQNKPILRSGHLPKANNEIVLDQQAKKKYDYRLGQTFHFSKSADLKQTAYKIVGFVDAPQYIDNEARGSANIGDGTVRFFAYLPEKQLALKVPTLLTLRFTDLQSKNTYSQDYEDQVDQRLATLKRTFNQRKQTKDTQLTTNKQQVDQQTEQLQQQLTQMQTGGLTDTSTYQMLTTQQAKLQQVQTQLAQTPKTSYTWQTRNDLPGFETYGESSDRIAAIANVFPVFFFLIAALITFTTVTRMVEENRGQIGTLKALGYPKAKIAKNYLVYALLAGSIGGLLGSILGNISLPRIVLSLYKAYIPLEHQVLFQIPIILIALVFALIATVGAAWFVVNKELTEGPAALMRPRSPKSAKRILLERITPLWSRLDFNHKVSYRNLFRFKSRLFMTIIGIAGGTALILTGFGIQDSIGASGSRQYQEVLHYQALVRLKTPSDRDETLTILQKDAHFKKATTVGMTTGKAAANGHQVTDINLYMPEDQTAFQKFIHLRDAKTKQPLTLQKSGLVLTQKMAKVLELTTGDTVTVTTTSGHKAKLKVTGITQNYVGHFAYLTPAAYQRAFDTKASQNTLLVQLKTQTDTQQDQLAQRLLDKGTVLGTSYTQTQQKTIAKTAATLDPIVMIFILLSGVLSFIVLYNLTNINISERIRELSTIKVLGFYDREVTLYIVRENIVLTIIGILLGYGVGNLLTAYILHQAATAQVIFPLTIAPIGYFAATALMILFTVIVMYVTHKRLQHIDMIDALKSNE